MVIKIKDNGQGIEKKIN